MQCGNSNNKINKTFIFNSVDTSEGITGGTPTFSACTALYTNEVFSCSGDTSIKLGEDKVSVLGDLEISGLITGYNGVTDLSGKILSGTTDGFVLGDISELGSGGDVLYTNNTPTPEKIGGIPGGSTFEEKTMKEMWDALLYPYQIPKITSFDRDNIHSGYYELGESISGGYHTFKWVISNSDNIKQNSITITDVQTSDILLNNGINSGSGSLNTTPYTSISSGLKTLYKITAKNTKGQTISRSIKKRWSGRWFYGTSSKNSISSGDLNSSTFSSELSTKVVDDFVKWVPNGGEFGYLIIPNYLKQPTDLVQSEYGCQGNNIPFSEESDITFDNDYGVSQTYKVYKTLNAFNGVVNVWLCS